jgi:periplasmic divalent cation tolerance protein
MGKLMDQFMIVLVTAGELAEAERIAGELVKLRLAACVNIVPQVASVYRWRGEIRRDGEVLLIAKTARDRYAELERVVKECHSYEVPEIIAISIEQGSMSYLSWLAESLAEDPETKSD